MNPHLLRNRLSKPQLLELLAAEEFERRTVSFYRYVRFDDPRAMRDTLYAEWDALGVHGRVYIAEEGINAQINVPEPHWDDFVANLESRKELQNMPLKLSVEEGEESFWKLGIKVKHRILADGLDDNEIDLQAIGAHINAEQMNAAINDPDALVIDMRNHYEYEVGRFEGAICPNTATFREALPKAVDMAKEANPKRVVLYCTGGIRCEKASAYFKKEGFEDVAQMCGGIIDYAHEVKKSGLDNQYKGTNYVFDGRGAERISDEVISQCHQCASPSDAHINCTNDACHLLFIQCGDCKTNHGAFCSPACRDLCALPAEVQRIRRRTGKAVKKALNVYNHHEQRNLLNQAWN